jgi:hypothetical protein
LAFRQQRTLALAETRARGSVWEFDHVVLDGAALELRVHGDVVAL